MIPIERAHLHVAAATHQGMRGKNNEDQFSVGAYQVSATDSTPALFTIVADGIGGHRAGEVAAEIAVEMISQAVAESDASQPTAIMQAAIIQASQAILAQAEADPQKQGMGTTCICAWVIDDRLYVASVGNSRLYLLRDGRMHQVNVDHTWVQEAVEAGALTPEQARGHPNANVIRRYLGSRKSVEVDLRLRLSPEDSDAQARKNQGARLLPGDRLLMCTDGLTDMVEDEAIHKLGSNRSLDGAVKKLVKRANENGGKDNITVVALEMPGAEEKLREQEPQGRQRRLRRTCLGIGAASLLGVAAAGFLGWYYFLRPPASAATPTATATHAAAVTEASFDTPSVRSSTPILAVEPSVTYTPWPTDTPLPSPTPSQTPTATQSVVE